MSDSRNEVNTKGNPNFVATEAAEQGIKALINTRKEQCQANDQGYNTENGACCDCEIEELECKNDKCSNGCKEEKGICEMPINLITQKKENKKKETTEKIQVLKKELENLEQNKTDYETQLIEQKNKLNELENLEQNKTDYETQLREQKNKLNKLNESQNTDNIIIVNGTIRGTNALIKDAREKINKITNEINVLTTELEKYQSGGKKKRGKSRKKRKTKRRRKNTRKSRRKRKTKRRRKNTRKSRRKRKTKRRRKRKTKRRRRRRR